MRTMWVHAYQGHVWNSLACSRIRLLGAGAVPGDLVLLDGDAAATALGTGTTDASVAVAGSPSDGKDDVSGAESIPPASAVVGAAGGTNEPSGADGGKAPLDGIVSAAAAAAGEPSRDAGAISSGGRGKGAVSVLTREVMESFASRGVTPGDLLRSVVLPLAGTSVQYPQHGVREPCELIQQSRRGSSMTAFRFSSLLGVLFL